MVSCSKCGSDHTVKDGHIHTGKQRYLCRECGYQYVEDPSHYTVPVEKRSLIDRLLHERLSLAGIARAVEVSETWLQGYVTKKIYGGDEVFSRQLAARRRAGRGVR
jgi:transposase-like protein